MRSRRCVRRTEQQHAGVGVSQTVGGEAGVVAKVLLRDVGKQQQRARFLVFDPQGVVVLHRPAQQRRGRRGGRAEEEFEKDGFVSPNIYIKKQHFTTGDLNPHPQTLVFLETSTSHRLLLQNQYYLPLIVKKQLSINKTDLLLGPITTY